MKIVDVIGIVLLVGSLYGNYYLYTKLKQAGAAAAIAVAQIHAGATVQAAQIAAGVAK